MKKLLSSLIAVFLCTASMFAQEWESIRPVDLVKEAKEKGGVTSAAPMKISHVRNVQLPPEMENYSILDLDRSFYNSFNTDQAPSSQSLLEMNIPSKFRNGLTLQLVEVDITSGSDQVLLLPQNKLVDGPTGKHYRGIVKGNEKSIVAISVFENEIMGLISGEGDSDMVLGKLEGQDQHILYETNDIKDSYEGLSCSTTDEGPDYTDEDLRNIDSKYRGSDNCVKLYLEVDYDVFLDKGSSDATRNFAEGFMNQVMTMYANEYIRTSLMPVAVWTTNSGYSGSSTSQLLNAFQNKRYNQWEGTLAGLVSYKSSGGVAAGFSGICNSNRRSSMCYNSIGKSYRTVPTYSWTVDLVTHEFGHLFGSRHTHACVWNGNNTAIDGCSGFTEGSCSNPGNPPRGQGTIMSYCHQSVGKNLSLGFGTQPGNVIRNRVYNATCLSTNCGGVTPTDPSPSCETNAYENNNSISAAAKIPLNEEIAAKLGYSGDQDYYKVDLASGNASFVLDGPANKDFELFIYNSSGTKIGESTNSDADESISTTLSAGTYYVRVFGYNDAYSSSCYSLKVTGESRCGGAYENNNSISNAASIEVGTTIQAAISQANDDDFYKISLGRGDATVVLDGPANKDFELFVYNSSGTKIGESTTPNADETVTFAATSGTYYIKVEGYETEFSSECYSLNVTQEVEPEEDCTDTYENNNSFYYSTILNNDASITSALGTSGDQDYFRFYIGSTSNISINLTGPSGKDYEMRLYNRYGNQVASSLNPDANESIFLSNASPGRYFIRIYGYNNAYSSECYSLDISTPNAMPTGMEEQKEISISDVNIYPNPNNGDYLNIKTSTDDAKYMIFDNQGKLLLKGDTNNKVDISSLENGFYIVKINSSSSKDVISKKLIVLR